MIPFHFTKQSWESRILDFDGEDTLASDDVISSVGAKVFDYEGTDVSATMIEGAPSFTTNHVQVQVKAGTNGSEYTLELKIYTANDERIEDDLEVRIRDKDYETE